MAICKAFVRTAVIGALAGGAVVVIAGPHRVGALLHQARHSVISVIDDQIDDPVVLRHQLQRMKAEYPQRIEKIAGEIAAIDHDIAALEQDHIVALGVAEKVGRDLAQLEGLLDKAKVLRASHPSKPIDVRWNHHSYSLDRAYAEGAKLQQIVAVNVEAAQGAERELELLRKQRAQMDELHNTLLAEQAKVIAQLARLDAQINSIQRNERLIEMVEQRQKTLDELGEFESLNVDQFERKLESIREGQNARLRVAIDRGAASDYEARVRAEVKAEAASRAEFESGRDLLDAQLEDDGFEVSPSGVRETPALPDHDGRPVVVR